MDADCPGRQAALRIAGDLERHGAADVRIVELAPFKGRRVRPVRLAPRRQPHADADRPRVHQRPIPADRRHPGAHARSVGRALCGASAGNVECGCGSGAGQRRKELRVHSVLIVESGERLLCERAEQLLMDGYAVDAVSAFEAARIKLTERPDALVL